MPFRIDVSEVNSEAEVSSLWDQYDGFIWIPTPFGLDPNVWRNWVDTPCMFYTSSKILYAVVKALSNGNDWGRIDFRFPRIRRLFVEATSLEVIAMIRRLKNPVYFAKRGVINWEE